MEQIPTAGEALIGVAAALLGGGLKFGASWLDGKVGSVDRSISKALKGPVMPAVVLPGLSVLLPMAAGALGISDVPTADVVASAPVATVIAIAAREAALHWVAPFLAKLFGKKAG